MLNSIYDKSFVDDLVASRYCKCESSLCCYEALRFILCFYDLFFPVSEVLRIPLSGYIMHNMHGVAAYFFVVFFRVVWKARRIYFFWLYFV